MAGSDGSLPVLHLPASPRARVSGHYRHVLRRDVPIRDRHDMARIPGPKARALRPCRAWLRTRLHRQALCVSISRALRLRLPRLHALEEEAPPAHPSLGRLCCRRHPYYLGGIPLLRSARSQRTISNRSKQSGTHLQNSAPLAAQWPQSSITFPHINISRAFASPSA